MAFRVPTQAWAPSVQAVVVSAVVAAALVEAVAAVAGVAVEEATLIHDEVEAAAEEATCAVPVQTGEAIAVDEVVVEIAAGVELAGPAVRLVVGNLAVAPRLVAVLPCTAAFEHVAGALDAGVVGKDIGRYVAYLVAYWAGSEGCRLPDGA